MRNSPTAPYPSPRYFRLARPWLLLALLLGACAQGEERPAVPAGLVASSGNRSVTLTWSDVNDATDYTIYWSETSGVTRRSYSIRGAKTPYAHAPIQNGTRFYYRVAARNGAGESELSTEVWGTPSASATATGAPASVTAQAADGQVTLSWGQVAYASGYTIHRDTLPGVYPGNGTEISGATSPYVDKGLQNGSTYYYVVTATVDGKRSLPSAEVSATPGSSSTAGPPASVSATPGNGQVTLSWSAVAGATSYTVYWATTSGVTKTTGTAQQGVASPWTHSGLTNGTPYYYAVSALVAGKETGLSTVVSATPTGGTTPTVPAAPTGLSATPGNGQVTLSWSAVSGATGYTLYWSTSASVSKTTGSPLSGVTSPYTHSGLTNGTTYYYVVTARNAVGEGAASSVASASPSGGSTTTKGTITGGLSGGVIPVVVLENTVQNQGLIQLLAYTGKPFANPPVATPVSGLTVSVSGAASGSLPYNSQTGGYQNVTPGLLQPGTYTFTVSGGASGTVTATVSSLASCTVTTPTTGSSHQSGQDLTLKWSSQNSEKAQILIKDTQGTIQYSPLKPDPGGVIVPGKDLTVKGAVTVLVSASWSVKTPSLTAGMVFLGDCSSQITVY